MKKTKNKNRDAQKKRTSHKAGVSFEAGREFMVGMICEKVGLGLEQGVKWREWGVDIVRRCGRRMNREVRDRGTAAGTA